MGIFLTDRARRGQSGEAPFPLTWEEDVKTSMVTVADTTAMNTIPEWKRIPFMTVNNLTAGIEYQLGVDITIAGQVWTPKTYGLPSNVVTEDEIFDVNGYILPSLIQNIFLNTSYVVASQAAMLTLTSLTGNFFIRTDLGQVFIKLNNTNPALIGDFTTSASPGAVLSVNGFTGVVNITIANLLAVPANQTAFDVAVTANTTVASHTGSISTLTSGLTTTNTNVTNLDTYVKNNIGLQALSTLAKNPTASEVGYALKWDGSVYNLLPDIGGGGGSSSFIGLVDVPLTYTGQTLKGVRVNAGETALEFYSIAAGNPFADNVALVKNNADNTKQIIFSAASITTATTRTYTLQNSNGTLAFLSDIPTITASNGLTKTGNDIRLGGNLTAFPTLINNPYTGVADDGLELRVTGFTSNPYIKFYHLDDGLDYPAQIDLVAPSSAGSVSIELGEGAISIKSVNGAQNFVLDVNPGATNPALKFIDARTTRVGIQYDNASKNYSHWTDDTFTDKGYVLGAKTYTALQTFRDDYLIIQDNLDLTKQANFQLSGITTGTTRTLTVPNASGTLALTSDLTGYVALTGTSTATGTMTLALGANPLIITSGVTTGTGATSGFQLAANSLSSGNVLDIGTTSGTSGILVKAASTSTLTNHTVGTNSLGWFETSGANSTSAKTAIALSGVSSNTGTTSVNIGVYAAASGGATNYAILTGSGLVSFGDKVLTTATSTLAALNLASFSGTPSTTSDGDLWINAGNIQQRLNTVSYNIPRILSAAQSAGRVVFHGANTSNAELTESSGLTFSTATGLATTLRATITQGAVSSAWAPALSVTPGAHTAQLTTVNYPNFVIEAATQTGASGTVAIANNAWIKSITYAGTSGTRTATISASLQVDPMIAGTNGAITNNYAIYSTGSIALGNTGTPSELRFLEPSAGGVNYTAFKAVAQATDLTYSLPPAFVAGGALTDVAGNGTLTWVVPSGGSGITVGTTSITNGTSTRIPFNDGGIYGEDAGLVYDKTNDALTVDGIRLFSQGTGGIFLGQSSGNFTLIGQNNVGIGSSSLDAVTTGGSNVAIGSNTLTNLTDGNSNTAIGHTALTAVIGGSNNTAVGWATLDTVTTGIGNTAIGSDALGSISSTNANTAIGGSAGTQTTGSNNTLFGYNAGRLMTTGSDNIFIGFSVGENHSTGSGNILIGKSIEAQSITTSNQLSIQNIIFGTGNSGTGTTISTGNIGIAVTNPLSRLHLAAGSATANTAPLQFNSGTLETAIRAGLYEYNGNHYLSNATLRFPVGGPLFDYTTDATAGGAETDIYSSTLAANTFNANKDKVTATYSGQFVTGGTELTQLKVYLAGTAIWDSTGVAPSTGTTSWRVTVELIRVSSTVVRYTVSLNTTGASGYVYCKSDELTGLTLSNTNILKITGISTGVGSGSGDIIGKQGTVRFDPVA